MEICSGSKYGWLTAIRPTKERDARNSVMWEFQCDCGKLTYRSPRLLRLAVRHQRKASCGCTRGKHGHGKSKTRTYATWSTMIQRCTNSKNIRYGLYGGRGITVCEKWLKYEAFLEDMGEAAAPLTLDRVDNNKGYCAENCRWASKSIQAFNRRPRPGKSGIVGVYLRGGKWQAKITKDRKVTHLGTFKTLEEAIVARQAAEKQWGVD